MRQQGICGTYKICRRLRERSPAEIVPESGIPFNALLDIQNERRMLEIMYTTGLEAENGENVQLNDVIVGITKDATPPSQFELRVEVVAYFREVRAPRLRYNRATSERGPISHQLSQTGLIFLADAQGTRHDQKKANYGAQSNHLRPNSVNIPITGL